MERKILREGFARTSGAVKYALLSAVCFGLAGCQSIATKNPAVTNMEPNTDSIFIKAADVSPFEDRLRRKWDSPVIADLDQNGFQDVIITEHGRDLQIFWNEGGKFSAPQKFTGGDLHGVTAADYDRDGSTDLVVAQGGGDGLNPKKPFVRSIDKNRTFGPRKLFDYFEKSRGRATKFFDPNNDGALDLYLTGFPTDVQEGDIRSIKTRHSAFVPGHGDLHQQLQERGIENLLIGDTVTNFCCETSARDAMMLDYRVAMV